METNSTNSIISIAYDQIPGLDTLRLLGTSMLGLALAVYMLIELYRLIVGGRCDFLTPIVKIGGALLILNSLIPLGGFLSSALQAASTTILNDNVFKLASDSWAAAFAGVSGPLDFVRNLFSQVTWLCLFTWMGLVVVIIIKLVVIDIIFPILLAVVVITGALSIPIGVFPGSDSFKGWVKNLVEVSIWPLVFQILATLLFATFATQLKAIDAETVTQLRGMYNLNEDRRDLMNAAVTLDAVDEDNPQFKADLEKMNKIQDEVFFKFVKFLAITVAFGFLCLFTPFLARMIVRGESAGMIGGIAAAAGASMLARMGGALKRPFGAYWEQKMSRYAHRSEVLRGMQEAFAAGAKTTSSIKEMKAKQYDERPS